MSKKRLICLFLVSIVILITGVCFVYNYTYFHNICGEYESVDGENTTYSLTLSSIGKFSISDIGAGNPEIEGYLFKVPITNNKYIVNCLGDEDFDEHFLNIQSKLKMLNLYSMVIGREMDQNYNTIVFENGNDSIQFNQQNWLKTGRTRFE